MTKLRMKIVPPGRINSLALHNGVDIPESGYESLYQIATLGPIWVQRAMPCVLLIT